MFKIEEEDLNLLIVSLKEIKKTFNTGTIPHNLCFEVINELEKLKFSGDSICFFNGAFPEISISDITANKLSEIKWFYDLSFSERDLP